MLLPVDIKIFSDKKFKEDTYDSVVNIYMVKNGLRPGCLLEPAGYKKEEDVIPLLLLVEKLKLYKKIDNKGRILITKKIVNENINKDVVVGKHLGFYCFDHDFSSNFVDKTVVDIYFLINNKKVYVYVEVCEFRLVNNKSLLVYAKNLADKYKTILPFYQVKYELSQIDSTTTLDLHLSEKDVKYVIKNIFEYNNEMSNYYGGEEWVDETPKKFLTNDLLRCFYFSREKTVSLYQVYNGKNIKEIDYVVSKLLKLYNTMSSLGPTEYNTARKIFPEAYDIIFFNSRFKIDRDILGSRNILLKTWNLM